MNTKKTMHELAKEFPDTSYRELEKYRDADRQEEAQRIFTQQENEELTESQQKQEELEPIQHGMSSDAQKNAELAELKDQVKKIKERNKKIKICRLRQIKNIIQKKKTKNINVPTHASMQDDRK